MNRIAHYNGYDYYIALTRDEINDIHKCKNDFEYFAKYIYINDPTSTQPVKIQLYDKQKEFINIVNNNHYIIVLKSRQTGMSTISGLYALWVALFYPNSTIGILSKTGNDATRFLTEYVKKPFNYLPTFLKEKVLEDNKRSIRFNNNSAIISSTSTPTAFRSFALSFLIVDEA
ncbi:MAG: hypothetical protein QXV17_01420 [Candidatus Micrarchaeaceae archaeon]